MKMTNRKFSISIFTVLFMMIGISIDAQDLATFQAKACVACHGQKAEGNMLLQAPSLRGLHKEYIMRQLNNFKSGARGAHKEDVNGITMSANAKVLSDGDIEKLATELSALSPLKNASTVAGSPHEGKEKFVTCQACHGADLKGNVQLNAPPLIGLQDWYIVNQLKKFQKSIRASSPETDPIGFTMNAFSNMLANESEIRNVAAYIVSVSK